MSNDNELNNLFVSSLGIARQAFRRDFFYSCARCCCTDWFMQMNLVCDTETTSHCKFRGTLQDANKTTAVISEIETGREIHSSLRN